ncbi:hypothetical protein MANES_05G169800v8 [Manihot esculenta]|uniref:Uncharacterized protein n=1 Tax=Manihot esculenta TaxID=3983 RepID=A0A2C9VZ94_MANES|nr:hypothetical protein MANES_05G169800v8 [Manihot esculenta]
MIRAISEWKSQITKVILQWKEAKQTICTCGNCSLASHNVNSGLRGKNIQNHHHILSTRKIVKLELLDMEIAKLRHAQGEVIQKGSSSFMIFK